MEHLPAVANNIATLRQVITDADLWGLPDEHCVALLNPTSVDEVLDAVHAAASAASEALLFYFAGHGLLDDRSDLYLALPDSRKNQLYRAVRYDDVRREVVGTARACYGKVVILDCCFSGRALQGGMSGLVDLADHATVDGTYLMTASAETSLAIAPIGEDYTAFTGALVDKLMHGLPDGPDLLDMETLFHHVRADMQARHFPMPQARIRNDGKAIALVRNRHGAGRRTPVEPAGGAVRVLPQPPTGMEALLRRRPADVYAEVQALRANGQDGDAEQVLAASAALRADQLVAAIVDLLRRQGLAVDVRTVITAAAQRPPAEVLQIIAALHETDLPGEATHLVRAVGAGRVGDVAGLAHLLHVGRRAEDLVELLDAALHTALDTAQAQSSLIDLVNALWVAGLREEVDDLINRAISKLPGSAVVGLADELRAVGREPAAFSLYAASAEIVATRPPEVVATLCHAMTEAGRAEDSARIAHVMVDRAHDVKSLLGVATAFWDTDQNQHADYTLTQAAAVLSNAEVTALATELRARDQDQAAYQLCLRATLTRSAAAIQEIITALREEGRPVDARRLLDEVTGQVPIRTVADLLRTSSEGDQQRVLTAVTQREPTDVAELLDALAATHPVLARQFADLVTATATTRVGLLAISIDRLDSPLKEQIFASILQDADSAEVAALLPKLPASDAKLLMFLAVQAGNPTLASIIDALPTGSDSRGDSALRYLLDQPMSRLAALLDGLRAAHFDTYGHAVLDNAAAPERGAHTIAQNVAFLLGAGEADTAKFLLGKALHGRSNTDLTNMISALRQQNQPELLAAAAEWITKKYAQFSSSNIDGILRQIGLHEYTHRRSAWLKRRGKE